jgi:hypothetical protein
MTERSAANAGTDGVHNPDRRLVSHDSRGKRMRDNKAVQARVESRKDQVIGHRGAKDGQGHRVLPGFQPQRKQWRRQAERAIA